MAELIPVAGVRIKGLTNNIIRTSSATVWHKIFEENRNQYNCVMLGTMFTYANQDAVTLLINARKYLSLEPELIVRKLISTKIIKPYSPEISYKIENSKLTIWAKGYTYLVLSSEVQNTLEPYRDTPPEDAIKVDLNS